VYVRFGDHLPMLGESDRIRIHRVDPRCGFEIFATQIHLLITDEGPGTFYVFDCLSDLLSAWATDHMVGNFFRVTCPYLYELDTIAYFALLRNRHALKTVERIRNTTQVLLDVFNHDGQFHIQPLKVWQRNSPTMFLPHRKEGEEFIPVDNSFEATRLLKDLGERNRDAARRQIDHWHRLFLEAEERLEQLENAVRNIFASAMSEDALTYRQQRGLASQDEQMALLIQRVSGSYHGSLYFPELSGVGVSYNTFVWDREMDPQAGMQRLLKTVEKAYDYPVDIEFTVNFNHARAARIGVVQCRPLQTKGEQDAVLIPPDIPETQLFFRAEGNFMGGNISQSLKWMIWVEPKEYVRLPQQERYEVARLIGRLNKRIADRKDSPTLLLGPGRWGTSTPSLGIPISFSEINNFTALAEVAYPKGELMPELSFGSHFFQDLVEGDIFYLALFPEAKDCFFNSSWLNQQTNALEGLLPSCSRYKNVVKVCHFEQQNLRLLADIVSQQILCRIYHQGDILNK